MITPVRRCSPDCSGYRLARPLGVTIAVRCPACWCDAPLAPDSSYYARQPEPADAIRFEAALAAPENCLHCGERASFGRYECDMCMDRIESEQQDAWDEAQEQ